MQIITRTTNIDFGHRVVRERVKCKHFHGHLGKIELSYAFESIEEIGYAIDFKEIKRVHCQFLDDYHDHGFFANPQDKGIIDLCIQENSKLWIMSLNGDEFCNPSAENISKEIFLCIEKLTELSYPQIKLVKVVFYETPNCWVETSSESISESERKNFFEKREDLLIKYSQEKGVFEYDSAKCYKAGNQ